MTRELEPEILPARRLRVLFLNDTARNGGPGRSLQTVLGALDPAVVFRTVVLPREGVISERLRAAGCTEEIRFLGSLPENPFEPRDRPMEREDFAAPRLVRAGRLAANVTRGARAVAELGALVRGEAFDLVYCNGTTANFAGGALARASGVPTLWHARYTSIAPAIRPVHDFLVRSPDVRRVICVSHASAKVFEAVAHKVRVVHNAVDTDELDPDAVQGTLRAELGLGPDAVVFGSHGRVLRPKGYPEMIRAAHLALGHMTGDERRRARFVVLGDTPPDFRVDHVAECRALAAELGIAGNVTMLGFRPHVAGIVRDFDVAVVPSIYPDPLPRAVLESMALGRPVIAWDLGGIGEMIVDGVSGTLMPEPPDVERLAAEMLRYLRSPELRRAQGRAARARVLASFGGQAHARIIQNEIVRAVGPSARRGASATD